MIKERSPQCQLSLRSNYVLFSKYAMTFDLKNLTLAGHKGLLIEKKIHILISTFTKDFHFRTFCTDFLQMYSLMHFSKSFESRFIIFTQF